MDSKLQKKGSTGEMNLSGEMLLAYPLEDVGRGWLEVQGLGQEHVKSMDNASWGCAVLGVGKLDNRDRGPCDAGRAQQSNDFWNVLLGCVFFILKKAHA